MNLFEWLSGKKKAEPPPEPLVLGAKLQCEYGSQMGYLYVDTDRIQINQLPQACVEDCVAFHHIQPFGHCYGNDLCEFKMDLEEKWRNPEPQNASVHGKEIITTKSMLVCRGTGMTITPVTSGQDGIYAKQLQLISEMDQKYPGLRGILGDVEGSLYLKNGMYEMGLRFLEDRLKKHGGEIELIYLYGKEDLEGEYIRATLERLLVDCDTRAHEKLVDGLEKTAIQNGMTEQEGWNPSMLNAAMMKLLKKDCRETSEAIQKGGIARWTEEHKRFGIFMEGVTNEAVGIAIFYRGAVSESGVGRKLGEARESQKAEKKVEGSSEAESAGKTNNAPKIKGAKFNGKGGSEGGSGAKGDQIVFGSDTKSATKLNNQMTKRGWTESTVKDTVSNPYTERVSINKATGNTATVYYNKSGGYVIIDDVTNAIVQVSDNINPSTWVPDPSIVNPYLPNAPK